MKHETVEIIKQQMIASVVIMFKQSSSENIQIVYHGQQQRASIQLATKHFLNQMFNLLKRQIQQIAPLKLWFSYLKCCKMKIYPRRILQKTRHPGHTRKAD